MQHQNNTHDHARRSPREGWIGGVDARFFTGFLARRLPALWRSSSTVRPYRAEPGAYRTESGSVYLLSDIPSGVEVVRVAGTRSALPDSLVDRFTAAAVVPVAGSEFLVLVVMDGGRMVDALSTSRIIGFAAERPDGPFGPPARVGELVEDL